MKTDKDLQHNVLAELEWEPAVNAAHIGVTAKDGVVALTGHVPSYPEKSAAEKAAKRVYGVKAVVVDLDVKLPGSNKCNDEEIAAACVNALRINYLVPVERIKVIVKNSFITLEGEVAAQYERNEAYRAVHFIKGVLGVTNNITLKPKVAPTDVINKISDAFQRNAAIDARRIGVDTRNNTVVLHGSVRSWAEREEAQHAAWAVPGVTAVENNLAVTP